MKRWVFFFAILTITLIARGQRNYAGASVLSTGKWVKVSTNGRGIFKVTASFLQKAGFSTPISSNSIRLFGNGGAVLPESNSEKITDDLVEQQIEVVDGGDGQFDADDFFLFYAPGTSCWKYNSNNEFEFIKNPYTDFSYYFIQIAGQSGKRIAEKSNTGTPTIEVDHYLEHIRFEKDSFNFFNSGREWYGESFGNGFPSSRVFQVATEGVIPGRGVEFTSEVVGRSFDNPNKLAVTLNGKLMFQHSTPPSIGTLLEPIANVSRLSGTTIAEANSMIVGYEFTAGSTNAQSWLNWFEIKFQKSLRQQNDSFFAFRNPFVVGPNQLVAFRLSSSNPALKVWEVTETGMFYKLKTEFSTNLHRFIDDATVLREYVSFDPKLAKEPVLVGSVTNQNLHGEGFYDMIIIADHKMLQEARRFAQFRQSFNGLRVLVVSPEQVYNEFSSGGLDPSAIRNFIKMFYDRAGANLANRPKYLLLFGGTSFRFKETDADRKNLIPSFQSLSSLDPLTSYVSDDFFGYLDDGDDINTNIPAPMLDIAVGRLPVRTIAQAKTVVDKIIQYQTKSDLGTWRNEITLVADDEDFDLHFNDAEAHAAAVEQQQAAWNLNKIYLDAFQQSSGAGGARYPEVNDRITKGMNKGTLIWNYSGHGGNTRLAQEAILEKAMINEWQNQNRLPLFVTATCDFAPFDNPAQFSIGEDLLMGRTNGAIGLMTTTRLVFASSNKLINNNFLKSLFKKQSDGRYPTLGEAWLNSKNNTVASSGDFINARKFALLGDPSMKLSMPEYQVKTTRITNTQTGLVVDTINALNKYTLEGVVATPAGTLASDFNGNVFVSLYDQSTNNLTQANDPQSSVKEFKVYDNLIYFGKARVQSGKFSVTFVVPNDIRLSYGKARISYYAEDGGKDAQGVDESLVAGGFGGQVPNDNAGPTIQLLLNDEQFRNGSTVKESSLLIAKLADQSGIYLGRYGIGHHIQMVIDGDFANAQVLNDYFEPQLDENKAGEIRLQLPILAEGTHKIELKAWDVFNNSSTVSIDFKVAAQKQIEIEKFFNYPNPFSASTEFSVQLNGPTSGSLLQLEICSIDGKLLRKINQAINQSGLRFIQVNWDGKDEHGQKPQPGVYFARLVFKTKLGVISTKVQKLILL